jgi:hypothetical protein
MYNANLASGNFLPEVAYKALNHLAYIQNILSFEVVFIVPVRPSNQTNLQRGS